jgi:DNA-binding PadR family transcriptional regulator
LRAVVDGRIRRYYRLTRPGATTLRAETERLRAGADAATARLKRFGPGPATARSRTARPAW